MPLFASIRTLKGVGEKRAALYEKLGIRTLWDLLCHFPRGYEDWSAPKLISDAEAGVPCCIRGWVAKAPTEYRVRKGMKIKPFVKQ